MAIKRLSRALTTGLLATAMTCAGGSAATAATLPDNGVSRSTAGYAFTFLGSSDVFVPFDVFAPSGADAFGIAEIYVNGYECFAQNTVPATVDGLTSATAKGDMALECSLHIGPDDPPPPAGVPLTVQGSAQVDLAWSGEGQVERITVAGRYATCVARMQVRHAVVTGQVRVTIPDLGIDQSAVTLGDDDDSLRYEEVVCPPER